MSEQRFIIQFGMGVDLHGQDPTQAAKRAVRDAISENCLCGLSEILHLEDPNRDMHVHVRIACPEPERIDAREVLAELPFGVKTAEVELGGMRSPGLYVPELGDATSEVFVANAAVTVSVRPSR